MYTLMIVCAHCGAHGNATCIEIDTDASAPRPPIVIDLSREFYRQLNAAGELETACEHCHSVVELDAAGRHAFPQIPTHGAAPLENSSAGT